MDFFVQGNYLKNIEITDAKESEKITAVILSSIGLEVVRTYDGSKCDKSTPQ